jgi:serine/threonine protein kinase
LVQLYELFGDDRCWFFTMELVDGVTFHSYVRPGNVQTRWDRLRDALYQLTVGVQALHSSARLHRDLKPSNVLVSNEGRVVILDFGLVKELEVQSVEQTFTLVGSPAYMAPEQAESGPITEAVDWYAVGVMLFQAITGQLPFNGTWNQMLQRKQSEDFPLIGELAPDVPDDLNEICRQLLVCRADFRANGTTILDTLRHRRSTAVRATQGDFVGRSTELAVLQSSFSGLSSGSRRVVLLQGPSGIGKTAVVGQFLNDLREKHRKRSFYGAAAANPS